MHSARGHDGPVEGSSNRIVESVGRKLKYYIEVKRREDGFDLSSAYHPKMIYPGMKKRWIVMYDGARHTVSNSTPTYKYHFADKEIRRRLTHLKLVDKEKTAREDRIGKDVERVMEKTVVREYYVPHGYCKRDEFGNVVIVNRLNDLHYGTSSYGNREKSPFPGEIPTIRSAVAPHVSQSEAARIVNVASKIIACAELGAKEKSELMEERYLAAGINRTPRRSKSATTDECENEDDEEEEENAVFRVSITKPNASSFHSPRPSPRPSPQRCRNMILPVLVTKNKDDKIVTKKAAAESCYDVYVKTGNENGGSTEAPVYIILYGSDGRSQKLPLTRKRGQPVPFQKNSLDKFQLNIPHVGRIHHMKIGHDSDRMQDAWYLDHVLIHDHRLDQVLEFTSKKFIRPPHNSVVDLLPILKSIDDLPDNVSKTPNSARFDDDDRASSTSSSQSNTETRTTSKLSATLINHFFDAVMRNDEDAILRFLTGSNGQQFLYARNSRGLGAMHVAAMKGADNVISVLVRHGTSVETRADEAGFTPLHYAAAYKCTSTVDRLFSLGANPLALTSSKATPLHLAVLSGNFATVRALVTSEHMESYQALGMRDNDGAKPVDIARQQRFYDIEHFLNREAASLEASIVGEVEDEYDAEISGRNKKQTGASGGSSSRMTSSYQPVVTITKKGDEDFYKDAEV